MKEKLKLKSGFTVVELLIVIIVIGILATIVVMAYNGAQTRAKNAKTAAAVEAWAKALKLYQIKEDNLLAADTCLGNTDTYPSGECEPGAGVSSGAISALSPYLGNDSVPEPDTTKITNPGNSSDFRSGISYYSANGSSASIWYVQAGVSTCPNIGSLNDNSVNLTWNGGVQCVGHLTN